MYLSIDSKDRNIKGKNILDNQTYNIFNAINTQKDSDIITIKHNHNLQNDDKIRLELVVPPFQTLSDPFRIKNNFLYVHHPDFRNVFPLTNTITPIYAIINDIQFIQGTADINIISNSNTLVIQLNNISAYNNAFTLNRIIYLDLDADFHPTDKPFTIISLNPVKVQINNYNINKINSFQSRFYIRDLPDIKQIYPIQYTLLNEESFVTTNDWYKISFTHFDIDYQFGGNVKIKLDHNIDIYNYNNPVSLTNNGIRLTGTYDITNHTDEVDINGIQPIKADFISELSNKKSRIRFNTDADISTVKNSFMYFDFTNSTNSQIVLKNGTTIDDTMTFQIIETDILNNIVVEFGNEIDYANIQSGLLWKAFVDDIEYSGNILTPIELLNGNINSIELDLSNQTNHNFNINRCIETTVTNSNNISGIKLNCSNTSGTSVGDLVDIILENDDKIEFWDNTIIDNTNYGDSIVNSNEWSLWSPKLNVDLNIFNDILICTSKQNGNNIDFTNNTTDYLGTIIELDVLNGRQYKVSINARTSASNGYLYISSETTNFTDVYDTNVSTKTKVFTASSNKVSIGIIFDSPNKDDFIEIFSISLQLYGNQFEVYQVTSNSIILNAKKRIKSLLINNTIKLSNNVVVDSISYASESINLPGANLSNTNLINLPVEINGLETYYLVKIDGNKLYFDPREDTSTIITSYKFIGPDKIIYQGTVSNNLKSYVENAGFFANMFQISDNVKLPFYDLRFKDDSTFNIFNVSNVDSTTDKITLFLNKDVKEEYIVNQNMNIDRLNYISEEESQLELIMNPLNITYKVIDSNTYQNGVHSKMINNFGGNKIWFKWNDIAGIHNRYINAYYPLTNDRLQSYHVVNNVKEGEYEIKINQIAKETLNNTGGHIKITKINDDLVGYKNQNNYRIYFNQSNSNITSVSMVSSEFPNCSFSVKNKTLYWQDQEEENIYQISIDDGYYFPSTLATEIYQKALEHNVFMNINIDIDKQIFEIYSYSERVLQNNINTTKNSRELLIYDNNHKLKTGDTIIMSGCTNIGNLSGLNKEYTVTVLSSNNYTINGSDVASESLQDQGGSNIVYRKRNKIRLRLDYENSLGELLGFHNAGSKDFIIPEYSETVNNKEYNLIQMKSEIKHINIYGNKYILLRCKSNEEFGSMIHNNIKNIFAKIQLSEYQEFKVYNTFISQTKYFKNPRMIQFIDVEVLDENGDLFEFYDLDHSFTLLLN